MSFNIDNVKQVVSAAQAELAKCRKALIGPVTVLVTLALAGVLPAAVVGPILAIGSYLGIRQVKNKAA